MSIAALSTQRRVTVAMVTLTFVLFGLIALGDLKVNLLPDLSYPTLTVRTEYAGAAPQEIETLITQPIEEAVGVVKNLRKLRSVSRTGQSDVVLEFAWGTNMDMAGLEVRDKLEILSLPLEVKKPVLLRFNPSTDPILRVGLASSVNSEAGLKQLRRFADEELKKRLEPIAGVAAVKVGGGLEDEIQVEIDQQRLAQMNLSVEDVINRLRVENINASGGRIEQGKQRYLVRTVNEFIDVDEIRNILISVVGGIPVRMQDVATVRQSYKEREAIIRIRGRETVELAVYKEGDANTVAVAEAVNKEIKKLKQSLLPKNMYLEVVEDQSTFIKNSLAEVRSAAIEGGLLAILIIFFFLRDAWSTFVISLSLPISIIATFFFMGQAGLSLNVMSLGGLALATGLVVDDSIVVLENIARMRERGLSIMEAAVKGTAEVGMAVTASTLTTVAVFFPLVFVEGVAGQLFKDQALTVTIALLISLAVAMTLIPMLASLKSGSAHLFPEEPQVARDARARPRWWHALAAPGRVLFSKSPEWLLKIFVVVARFFGKYVGAAMYFISDLVLGAYSRVADYYVKRLGGFLERPKAVLWFAASAFIACLLVLPLLGLDLIPQLQQGRFNMTVKLPPGTPLAETDRVVVALQQAHARTPGIGYLYGVSGVGTRLDANPTESGENIARMLVALAPGSDDGTEETVTNQLRGSMEKYPHAETKFSRPELFSFATPVEVEISGFDLNVLKQAGLKLAERMSAMDRFADVKSSMQEGYPEIQIVFDQERAAKLGITTRQIADQVVRKVRGEVATRYSFRDRKIDVLVRANESDRASIEDIRNLIVNPQSEHPLTLSAVADVVVTEGPSEIHRSNQERVAVVSADLRRGDLGSAVEEIEALLRKEPLAAGVTVRVGGQSEELDASIRSLLFALGLAIFLVYLVMASQFESLLHPFVIMFTIPLAMVGAVFALFLTSTAISVVVFIGLILLVGIVVKNAIILIDRINQLRIAGVAKRGAIVQAAESRLRPITMTTLATLLGFLPLAIGTGEGAEVRAPMAIAVIGGLAVSTLLTLVVIPIVYDLLDRRGDEAYRARAKGASPQLAEETGSGH